MNVLSIGNSFSQDAHKWLNKLAAQNGIEIETANLFIPACSLETHWDNIINDNAFYNLEYNGKDTKQKISISEALKLKQWDVITLQQVSQLSGLIDSYEPYISRLISYVKENCPWSKLYLHQTWAYEIDSWHNGFTNYQNNQKFMYEKIASTTTKIAKDLNIDIIPVGTVIQYIRENIPEFDYNNEGDSLCRDGFHLSEDYGRYVAAATWLRVFTGKSLLIRKFNELDLNKLSKIISSINKICCEI